jgi:hypothetical protein
MLKTMTVESAIENLTSALKAEIRKEISEYAFQTTKNSSVPNRPVTNPLAHKKRAVALYRGGRSVKSIIRMMGNLNGKFPPKNTPHEGQEVWAWARELDMLEGRPPKYSASEYKRNKK